MNAKELAHNMIQEAKQPEEQLRKKVAEIAEQLKINYAQAESLVRQEIARKEASKKYRTSEAYKLRLEQQKIIRKMLKA